MTYITSFSEPGNFVIKCPCGPTWITLYFVFSPFACEPNCKVWRHSRQDCPHFGCCPWVWGLAKTTLRFDDVLEGPTELRASCSTHSCGVLQEKETDWNQPKGEAQGRVWANFLVSFLPCRVRMDCVLSSTILMCDTMHGILPIRGAHLSFLGGFII